MGAFQGVLAGIGETGAQAATGEQNAQEFALKSALAKSTIAAQTARTGVEQGQLELAKSGQQQAYQLAQQQHELYRQSIIDQGWRDNGLTMAGTNPDGTAKYQRNFVNMRDGTTRTVPVQGVPPDSSEGMMQHYHSLASMKDEKGNPQFSNIEAAQIAFKMPMLYRQGPAEQYKGFLGVGQEQFPNDPAKAQKLGQKLWDEYVGKAGYFHYGPGASGLTGGGRDMTGMTAGETRLFKAIVAPIELQEKALLANQHVEAANAVTPEQLAAVQAKYQPLFDKLEQQITDARMQVIGSRSSKLMTSGLRSTVGAGAAAPAAGGSTPPASMLKKGINSTMTDGSVWTLDANGQPSRVTTGAK